MIKLKNTDKAIKRLILALKKGEKIGIWSDYDPDGVFALVLAFEALINAGFKKEDLELILPNQYKYDRSFNKFHLSILKKMGIKLIIGIDFGTTDFKQMDMANEMGFEVILLDHHRQRPGKLHALLINPWQKGDRSKYKNWSGTGVAYLFFENLYKTLKIDIKKLKQSEDLILIPAITDYIKLDKGNLPYLKNSLADIKKNLRPGIRDSLKELKLGKAITITKMIEDRSNIADFYGILKNNGKKNNIFDLLTSKTDKEAVKISKKISKQKRNFEDFVEKIVKVGIKKFKNTKNKFILWGLDKDIKLVGAESKIADSLNEYFKIPVYFYKKEKNHLKGSARANYSNKNVLDSLKNCGNIFINFGGHPKAAGFHIKKHNLKQMEERLKKFYAQAK
ncbi:MAG: DHH family phosphoesterase [Patescibacteria group bacterium]|nr:DHH family phosphoesterase [Patescibacteria group bacterium]